MFKKTLTAVSLFYIIVYLSNVSAQTNNSGWNIFTSMKDVRGVGSHDNIVWAASTGGMFGFNLTSPSSSIVKYTTLDGLLSNELTSLVVDNSGNVWSGAIEGSISVYYPLSDRWRVISDIQTSAEPSKNINDIFQYGNFMFISTEFCIVKFDINEFQFVDQPYIYLGPLLAVKTPVYQTIVVNDTIWAATKNGIAYANINNYLPIQSSWSNFTVNNSVLLRNLTNTVGYFNNRVYFGTDSGMVSYDGTNLVQYAPLVNGNPYVGPVAAIAVSNGSMYFSTYRSGNFVFRVNQSNVNEAQLVYSGDEVRELDIVPTGELLFGTVNKGINVFKNNSSNYVLPNGPFSNLASYLDVDGLKNLWAVSGSLGPDWFDKSGIYKYDGVSWKNYTYAQYPVIGNGCCGWVQVYADRNNVIWVSGFGNGLLRINGEDLFVYNETNSALKNLGQGFVLVEGVKEDNNGKLWVLNPRTQTPIVNFTDSIAYPLPVGNSSASHPRYLTIDNYNTKWFTFHNIEGSIHGVMYFNEAANVGGLLSYSQLGADIGAVEEIDLDKNGEVWIATNNGVVLIRDPYQVIQNPGSPPFTEKMRIIENGISTPLTEHVLSLRVDALNNKWLGTNSNGLLYVSPDGSTILNQLNARNSPLTDDHVMAVGVDPLSGSVYYGNEKGITSYKTIAVEPVEECDEITAGPNPFIIPANNLLRIDGLVAESSIKILSISGTLVAEFETPGGRVANWDGRDINGNLVGSGIYIIVGYNKDGSKVCTGKVAIVRR